MPSFSNGKISTNELTNSQIDLEILISDRRINVNLQNLLSELPKSMRGSIVIKLSERSKAFDQPAFINWLYSKVPLQLDEKIKTVNIYKKTFHYSYNKSNNSILLKHIDSVVVNNINQ